MVGITSVAQQVFSGNPRLARDLNAIVTAHSENLFSKPHEFDTEKRAALKQAPLTGKVLTPAQIETVGKLQTGIPRLRIVDSEGRLHGTGSAVAINPSGLYLTVRHNAEQIIGQATFRSFIGDSFLQRLVRNMPDVRLFIDIPHIRDNDSGIMIESVPAKLLDYDETTDLALLSIDRSALIQDPRTYLKFEQSSLLRDTTTYKIGHFSGAEFNYLTKGHIVHPEMSNGDLMNPDSNCPCPECCGSYFMITTNPSGTGDSGSTTITEEGRIGGIPTFVSTPDGLNINFRKTLVTPTDDLTRYEQDLGQDSYSINASVERNVLPFLDRALGTTDLQRLLDGDEVVVSQREVKQRRSHRPTSYFIVISIGGKPGSNPFGV